MNEQEYVMRQLNAYIPHRVSDRTGHQWQVIVQRKSDDTYMVILER